ncbi:MAG: putative sugar nucleotidyl transferase [Candidatus Margulisiibacteriota bacterium]
MITCVFEDKQYPDLSPLTLARPVYTALTGIGTVLEKIHRAFPHDPIYLHARSEILPLLPSGYPLYHHVKPGQPCRLLNGRVLMTAALADRIQNLEPGTALKVGETLVAALVDGGEVAELLATQGRNRTSVQAEPQMLIHRPWDLFNHHGALLTEEFNTLGRGGECHSAIPAPVAIDCSEKVYIGHRVTLDAFVSISTEKGPVYIDDDATIQAFSRLEGPLYIGKHASVLGGRVSGSSIGAWAKVAGEISASCVGAYSNKAHAGYLGNSVLGEWVNLGAGTTTSNLKNTYGTIMVTRNGVAESTSEQFLGALIGDHVKTGIGTLINAGTVVGAGANVFGTTLNRGEILPFSWGEYGRFVSYRWDQFIKTLERTGARRNITYSPDQILAWQHLHKAHANV